ncbi:hypothetical protein [Streptomyces niveus]|uniref:hypothetical protein n=1 Tax=Streptomyces niveus TaxID=193462 RepID=UPI003432D70D
MPSLEPAAEISQLTAELSQLGVEAQQLTTVTESDTEPGTAVVPAVAEHAAEAKVRMARHLARLRKLQDDIDGRRGRLRELMEAQMAAAQRALGPLRDTAARMQEGIAAISLYLGVEEGIETLRDGAPAEADTPVALRQLVLSADQECMVAAESGGLDVRGLDDFFAWLLADARNLDQVLPEPKGIVALVPSRTQRRTSATPWFNAMMKEANAATFFLVRNGERLYAVFNELQLTQRLFPAADEFAKLFRDHLGRPLELGGFQWRKAEEKADATRRQYMKVGMLLQGLVDRTTILHPHPEEGLNLLDQDAIDAGRVVLIPDAETAYALEDGRERFIEWQRRLNAQLRPGMRVIVASRSEAFRELAYGREDYQRAHSRLHPTIADAPAPDTVYTIEKRRSDGSLVIRYERTDDVWTDTGSRPAKVRASCTVRPEDPFLLAYDAADPDELRAFLRNRVDRAHYLDMVPVINAAIAAKAEEKAAEAPFRHMLVGMLMSQLGLALPEAEGATAELVDWWKFANHLHRPLTGRDAEADAKAAQEILAESRHRQRAEGNSADDEVVETLASTHPDALLIAQTHAGRLVVLTPHESGPFVTEHTYSRNGQPRGSREWVLPGTRPNRWKALRTTQAWDDWNRAATLAEHLTVPEREALADKVTERARTAFPDREIAAVTLQNKQTLIAWTVSSWGQVDEDHPATGTSEPVTLEGISFGWRRDRRQQAVPGQSARSTRRWDQFTGRRPWAASGDLMVNVLQLNKEAIERAEACHARYQAVQRRGAKIRDAARRAYATAEAIWNERQERKAQQAFLAEYGQPSLWEGHRKTITLPPMPELPDRQGSRSRPLGSSWFTALTTLIENGEDLAALTLGQALEAQGFANVPEALYTLPLHRPV